MRNARSGSQARGQTSVEWVGLIALVAVALLAAGSAAGDRPQALARALLEALSLAQPDQRRLADASPETRRLIAAVLAPPSAGVPGTPDDARLALRSELAADGDRAYDEAAAAWFAAQQGAERLPQRFGPTGYGRDRGPAYLLGVAPAAEPWRWWSAQTLRGGPITVHVVTPEQERAARRAAATSSTDAAASALADAGVTWLAAEIAPPLEVMVAVKTLIEASRPVPGRMVPAGTRSGDVVACVPVWRTNHLGPEAAMAPDGRAALDVGVPHPLVERLVYRFGILIGRSLAEADRCG